MQEGFPLRPDLFSRLAANDETLTEVHITLTQQRVPLFAQAVKGNTHLRKLHIFAPALRDSTERVMGALAGHPRLSRLCLENFVLNDALCVAALLQTNQTLKKLFIYQTGPGNDVCVRMCVSIRNHSNLKILGLDVTFITNTGWCALANMLKTNRVLQSLQLVGCANTNEGFHTLTDALCLNDSLMEFNFDCWGNGGKNAADLAKCLASNTSLTKLTCSGGFAASDRMIFLKALKHNHSIVVFYCGTLPEKMIRMRNEKDEAQRVRTAL
jgi:hypothetical protein